MKLDKEDIRKTVYEWGCGYMLDEYMEMFEEVGKIYHNKQLSIHGVINWLPFVRENYPEFDKLTREKNCLCLYDDGTEIDFEKENHPIAIMTHFKAKT